MSKKKIRRITVVTAPFKPVKQENHNAYSTKLIPMSGFYRIHPSPIEKEILAYRHWKK